MINSKISIIPDSHPSFTLPPPHVSSPLKSSIQQVQLASFASLEHLPHNLAARRRSFSELERKDAEQPVKQTTAASPKPAHISLNHSLGQEIKAVKEKINELQLAIQRDYGWIIEFIPNTIVTDLENALIPLQKGIPKGFQKMISMPPQPFERLQQGCLQEADFEFLTIIHGILLKSPKNHPGFSFLKNLKILYGPNPDSQMVNDLVQCPIFPEEERENVIEAINQMNTDRRELIHAHNHLAALNQHKFDVLYSMFGQQWIEEASRHRHGKCLINRHTQEGKNLLRYCDNVSLEEAFGAHSILVDKDGKIFLRTAAALPFAKGAYKKVFRVEERTTHKAYTWTELKKKRYLDRFKTLVMENFCRFLETNPQLAFNPVPQFIDYVDPTQKEHSGVSIGRLYEGDAYHLRRKQKTPVLDSQAILELAEGLTQLHRQGFVHRDIKGPNILVKGKKSVWHDYDFLCEANFPNPLSYGTEGYIPPEHTLAEILTKPINNPNLCAADVFAFGVTLYQDLDPSFKAPGFQNKNKDTYIFEMEAFLNPPYTPFQKSSFEDQKTAFSVWLETQQLKHEGETPEDHRPYLAYRQVLWEAMSPEPNKRPDAATFQEALKQLYEREELP